MVIFQTELLVQVRRMQITIHDANRTPALCCQHVGDVGTHPGAAGAGFSSAENHTAWTLGREEQVLRKSANLVLHRSAQLQQGCRWQGVFPGWGHRLRSFYLWLHNFMHSARLHQKFEVSTQRILQLLFSDLSRSTAGGKLIGKVLFIFQPLNDLKQVGMSILRIHEFTGPSPGRGGGFLSCQGQCFGRGICQEHCMRIETCDLWP